MDVRITDPHYQESRENFPLASRDKSTTWMDVRIIDPYLQRQVKITLGESSQVNNYDE